MTKRRVYSEATRGGEHPPVAPVAPVEPVLPVEPMAPVAPVSPVAPVAPVTPGEYKRLSAAMDGTMHSAIRHANVSMLQTLHRMRRNGSAERDCMRKQEDTPIRPVAPVAPVNPVAPVAPVEPAPPVPPVNPVAPVSPAQWE